MPRHPSRRAEYDYREREQEAMLADPAHGPMRSMEIAGTAVRERTEEVGAVDGTDGTDRGTDPLGPQLPSELGWRPPRWVVGLFLGGVAVVAVLLRLWAMNRFGLNSDEAVYIGQAANLAGFETIADDFSVFRAHPLAFQFVLSLILEAGGSLESAGRYLAAAFGFFTIPVVYLIGRSLFNTRVAVLGSVFIALMPLHIIVSRQALLEAPLTFFFTLAMLMLVYYRRHLIWQWAAALGIACGMAFLSKEVGILALGVVTLVLLVGGVFAGFRWAHVAVILVTFAVTVSPHFYATGLGGEGEGGGSWVEYVIWQIGRPPNHPVTFYIANLTVYFTLPLLILLVVGLVIAARALKHNKDYLIPLLWFSVPALFFQVFKVRGFHYIVPVAGAVALLAALPLDRLWTKNTAYSRTAFVGIVSITVAALISLSAASGTFLVDYSRVGDAGYSGIPGGRETGLWLRDNTPEGVRVVGIGPSMANILRFYGDIDAQALSVSANPLRANPAYQPVRNPDYRIRWGLIEYLVYDVYSADRTSHFANRVLDFAERYGSEIVHEEYAWRVDESGKEFLAPVVRVYRVAPVTSGAGN